MPIGQGRGQAAACAISHRQANPPAPSNRQQMFTRPATPEDSLAAAEVVRLVYEEFGFTWDPDDYHADLHDLAGSYLDAGHGFWVAEIPGRGVIGTAALEIFPPIAGAPGLPTEHGGITRIGGTDCSLERLYVIPDARGGAGTALMREVVDEARRRGRKRMEIWSDKRFEAAHRLYGRFGARPVGERVCSDPDQSPEWGLVIDL